jgi:predicted deacetylase
VTGSAIVSIHDVMPATLGRVQRIVALLEEAQVPPATLLVVPGKGWSRPELKTLKNLVNNGHPLAGHGWVHKAPPGRRTPYHRLHGLLISRNEAEHLSRPAKELAELIQACHDWFATVDLPSPELYVPPAWALGALRIKDLNRLPFRWYEVLRGFVEAPTSRVRWFPLAGFEADTTFRKVSLRIWNRVNGAFARGVGAPLRISIHPDDLDLLLGQDLKDMIRDPWQFVRESQALGSSGSRKSP